MQRFTIQLLASVCLILGASYLAFELRPANFGRSAVLDVRPGEGFRELSREMADRRLIRSRTSFELYVLLTGSFLRLQAGSYEISAASSTPAIVDQLVSGLGREVRVTIPEDSSLFFADKLLSDAGVLGSGELIAYAKSRPELEGTLFPDTYLFYPGSNPEAVISRFRKNFEEKTGDILSSAKNPRELLILASLVEKEVPDPEEQRIVAGILGKRLKKGMPLQVDASVCYIKQVKAGTYVPCLPFKSSDFKTDSPYNTYLYRGLPPGPIGSPGADALRAALAPVPSDYWFYLSDPVSKKTIFAETFEEHIRNRARYLGGS